MTTSTTGAPVPQDKRAIIAVDLGAESCRVSLLRWINSQPAVVLVHRFGNAPLAKGDHLYWDLPMILDGVEEGLRRAAELAPEGVRSIAVDGWAVDYVRLDEKGEPLGLPFCYRDPRNMVAQQALSERIPFARLRELTGVENLPFNTLYQLYADSQLGLPAGKLWLNLPEYLLYRWGAAPAAELTNATHTQMMDLYQPRWSQEILDAAGIALGASPTLVPPGTDLGQLAGPLAELPAFAHTRLIAPACHDTASAIAGIPASGSDWAYISSGTWSLVGTLVNQVHNTTQTAAANFTNLGAVGDRHCFHKNVNGMWLIKQCQNQWAKEGNDWPIADLISAAAAAGEHPDLIEVDDPELLPPHDMPGRIAAHLQRRGLSAPDVSAGNAPVVANLIFRSLAARYAQVLEQIAGFSGKNFKRLFIVGGGSQNVLLNRFTAEATGLEVHRGSVESSTVGNFAVQLAVLEGYRDEQTGAYSEHVARWSAVLCAQQ